MKLVSFEWNNEETYGYVVNHPITGEDWVLCPKLAEEYIRQYCDVKTSGYQFDVPVFLEKKPWPDTMRGFLALEDEGMDAMQRLFTFTKAYIQDCDANTLLYGAGCLMADVRLLPPVPDARLLWGIVGNSPGFTRNHLQWPIINLIPQGHVRHSSASIAHQENFIIPGGKDLTWAGGTELGVIIGKKARNVKVDEAMQYVAGYTIVNDGCYSEIFNNQYPELLQHTDVQSVLPYQWVGKTADGSCSIGPWIVTRDEVGHPYDLNVFTRYNDLTVDHANTCSMLVGVERTIAYYTAFATLYPGDIIHMGCSGKDGLPLHRQFAPAEGDKLECGIERIGVLKNSVCYTDEAWKTGDKEPHVSYYARKVIQKKLNAAEWKLEDVQNFAIVYGNYQEAEAMEGYRKSSVARYLWTPSSALGQHGDTLQLPTTGSVIIGIELAMVIGSLCRSARGNQGSTFVCGYVPMITVSSDHLEEEIILGGPAREKALAHYYERWADGSNIVGNKPQQPDGPIESLVFKLFVDGELVLEQQGNCYLEGIDRVIESVTMTSTLLPGDVVTMGRMGKLYVLDNGMRGEKHTVRLEVSGMTPLECIIE